MSSTKIEVTDKLDEILEALQRKFFHFSKIAFEVVLKQFDGSCAVKFQEDYPILLHSIQTILASYDYKYLGIDSASSFPEEKNVNQILLDNIKLMSLCFDSSKIYAFSICVAENVFFKNDNRYLFIYFTK